MHKKNVYLPILILTCIFLTSLFSTVSAQTSPPTEADCRQCHELYVTNYVTHHTLLHTWIPVGTVAPYGTPWSYYECESCHATESSCGEVTYIVETDCMACHVVNTNIHHTPAPTSCAMCHNDTRPADPHPQVGDCSECHVDAGNSWLGATYTHSPPPSTCNVCHEDTRPVDPHPQTSDCVECHVDAGNSWLGATYTHSPPPLTCNFCHEIDRPSEPHPQIRDCAECHLDAGNSWLGATYTHSPPPSTCNVCHEDTRPADPHPQVGDCSECHVDAGNSWLGATYDHSSTGAVQLLPSCVNCHEEDPISSVHKADCGLCHLNPNGGGPMVEPYESIAPLGGDCSVCHGTMSQVHQNLNHIATPGSGPVIIFADTDHDDAGWNGPRPYFDILVDCNLCHSTDLPSIHGQRCETCHPSLIDSLGTWNGSCGQSACHQTIHENSIPAHLPFENAYNNSGNDCNICHNQSWDVPQSSCLNCHDATYGSSDITPPVTTSDAKTTYIGPAEIDFSIKDEGRVGIGTTFYRIDNGAAITGSNVLVSTPGTHSLEFWSMDQAGNLEIPKPDTAFTIIEDTTPPTTTSNAYASYYNGAYITLTATDNSSLGVKTTYYQLNGGPTRTGRTVSVQAVNGVVPYELHFWSEDWSGNVEEYRKANFTVTSGTVTLRLVWGNSDINGSPCPGDPEAWADWYIRRGGGSGYLVASGGGGCPDWSGVDDIVVPVSPTPYHASIWWWDSRYGWDDNTTFTSVLADTPGDIIRLSY